MKILLIWITITEINHENIMKEIDPIAGTDHGATIKTGRKTINCEIIMKEVGPITEMIGTKIGITHGIIIKETHPIVGI